MKSEMALGADLKKNEIDEMKPVIGSCMARARKRLGWSLKELANAIEDVTGKSFDQGQLSKWESGAERLQMDVLWVVGSFRAPFLISMASTTDEIEVVTEIRMRGSK